MPHSERDRRPRDRDDAALLDQPAQCDLRQRPSLVSGDIGEHRVAQQASAAERAICGEDQTALAARLDQLGLVEMGVILGLERHQRLRAKPDRFIEQRDIEVRDADMAVLTVSFVFLRAP